VKLLFAGGSAPIRACASGVIGGILPSGGSMTSHAWLFFAP
jgi:hypothetical protein